MKEHSPNIEPAGAPANGLAGGGGTAASIVRGVTRLLRDLGYEVVDEFPVGNARRVDVAGLGRDGRFVVVEVKASVADFRADTKWPEYLAYGDEFYFAVGPDFPLARLPDGVGIIVADAYEGTVVRAAPRSPMNASRRKAQTIRFARTAVARLGATLDPGVAKGLGR